jgi:hypothetical protein
MRFLAKSSPRLQQTSICCILHGEKRGTVRRLPDMVDRNDVGMIEAGYGLGFAAEAGQRLVRIALIPQDAFQGDDASGKRFPGAIDYPHPAAGDLVKNLVIANAPIPVPGFYGRERLLERLRFQGNRVVIQGALEKTVQTKAVREAGA